MKITRALSATTLFVLLLASTYFIHITYFRVNVVFYAAILDGFIAAALTGIITFRLDYFRFLGDFEKILLLIIWAISGYAFAISIPTVIDRSLSFYILEKLQQRGGGIRQDSFEQVFTQEYVKEHRLVDVRLTEQVQSGTIIIQNGCVLLTPKGERIANFSRYFRGHLLPKQRLLMGEYSDDLTNPFKHSVQATNYQCTGREN